MWGVNRIQMFFSFQSSGSFLAVPAGIYKADAGAPSGNATYVFNRGEWWVWRGAVHKRTLSVGYGCGLGMGVDACGSP